MELIGEVELRRRLPMAAAIDALEEGFRSGDPAAAAPLRSHLDTADGALYLMPAATPEAGAGVKVITITPSNPDRSLPMVNGVYVLFRPGTQEPEAVFDGAALTAIRTAAVSGLATRFLARPDAHRLVVFGAGVQARAHVEAMRAVRPVDDVVIVSRTAARARSLASEIGGRVGEPDAVADADLVCTCTTSRVPVCDGALLAEGVHVNAIGAYTPDTREVDDAAVRRADVIVVETAEVALAEAGDLLLAFDSPAEARLAISSDLAGLVRGKAVRTGGRQRTLFVSVGMAFEDLLVARAAVNAG